MKITVQLFGHASCRLEVGDVALWFNPTHALTATEHDGDWLLLTDQDVNHIHTIAALAGRLPKARFVAPAPVAAALFNAGVSQDRVHIALADAIALEPPLSLRMATTQSDKQIGYLLDSGAGTLLLATPNAALPASLARLQNVGPIDTAFLPIGESQASSDSSSVIHAISARAGFHLASTLNIRQVVLASANTTPHGFYPEELRLLQDRLNCKFNLLLNPTRMQIGPARASVVVRTLNEARYLRELLEGIVAQQTDGIECEVVLVDSGSTDDTLAIAEHFGCRILHIARKDFSFGRSLNIGCEAATGNLLVITSGHCVPVDPHWLKTLCQPLLDGQAEYSYGRQLGGPESWFSECRVFEKYFPAQSRIPQQGFYCNNANSALLKSAWQRFRFNEELTGLEDMELAQRLVKHGGKVAYVSEAAVYHYHSETWVQVRRRFEREAIALQQIMPNVHVSLMDALRYTASSIWHDWKHAHQAGIWAQKARQIMLYRYYQYSGSYRGNHEHRKLSHAEKDKYFYPIEV